MKVKKIGVPFYDEKMKWLCATYGACPVCGKPLSPRSKVRYHHMMHNTSGNRKRYRWFLNSLANGLPYLAEIQDKENRFTISDKVATAYENFYQMYSDFLDNKSNEPDVLEMYYELLDVVGYNIEKTAMKDLEFIYREKLPNNTMWVDKA